jgi:hypothetical protein
MRKTHQLEQQYAGDDAWTTFVAAIPEGSGQCPAELVKALNGHVDLAKAAFFHVGEVALSWVNNTVPALDGLTPVECAREPRLVVRLRSMLMRMP